MVELKKQSHTQKSHQEIANPRAVPGNAEEEEEEEEEEEKEEEEEEEEED